MKPITAPIEWTYMHPGDMLKCRGPKSRLVRFASELGSEYEFEFLPDNGNFMVKCLRSPRLTMQWERPK